MSIRLEIINNALVGTGNNALNVEYDGTDEWQAADVAYRRAIDSVLSRHRWGFGKASEQLVAATGDVPHPRYTHAYAMPASALHLAGVYIGQMPLSDYQLVDEKVCCNIDAANLGSDRALKALFIRTPDENNYPAGFREAVTMMVEAHLYRSLNEDPDQAARRERDAETFLTTIRTQTDQESGRRAVFRSRTAERRRFGGTVYRGFP